MNKSKLSLWARWAVMLIALTALFLALGLAVVGLITAVFF